MSERKNETLSVDDLIHEVAINEPIKKIISGLENKEFRDCDTEWLNEKMVRFTQYAVLAMDVKVVVTTPERPILNDHNRNLYIENFKTLLEFFEKLDE